MNTKAICRETILSERLRRQRFTKPLGKSEEYVELFRLLQPVSPIFFSRPGDPPRLVHRTKFDDGIRTDRLRAQREIIKGRFLGGNIGYVLVNDFELYANSFCCPLSKLNETQRTVLNAVKHVGPITAQQIKEETGLLNKEIMPALHRLQKAFLVYEDQLDSDWERGWYEFKSEWSDIVIEEAKWAKAAAEVLLRFIKAHVFATFDQLKDWSRFPSKPLKSLICQMEESNTIVPLTVDGLGQGWLCSQDVSLKASKVLPCVFMLHKSDILVRSHISELKRRFGEREVLQYLLIDGAFQGAVLGHWRIGPHDVEDIIVELPVSERKKRQEEILNAVTWEYRQPRSQILKYDGKRR